jgi:hypothetical protein
MWSATVRARSDVGICSSALAQIARAQFKRASDDAVSAGLRLVASSCRCASAQVEAWPRADGPSHGPANRMQPRQGELLVAVTDHAGHHLGYVNRRLVNQIPGAHYVLLTADQTWKDQPEPILYVPANAAYTITIDGASLTAPDTGSIGIIGPSWDIALNSIPIDPGDKDTLMVDANATRLTYRTERAQSPTIAVAVSDTNAQYAFVIAGVSSQPGSTITLGIPAEGGSLVISDDGSTGASSVDLQMTRSTEQGVQHFVHRAVPLAGGDTAELQFGNWTNPDQGIPLITTHGGHQSSKTLANE